MTACRSLICYTNRNVAAYDFEGNQIIKYQEAMTCYKIDKAIAMQVVKEARFFYVAKWGEWSKEITRKEMEYLLGLRTLEMDLEESNF